MSSFNKLIIMGNLVGEPDIRQVGDQDVAKFAVAVNDSYKGDSLPTYVDCEFWNPGKVAGFFSKGKPVLLEGRIKQDRWTSPQGEKRSKMIMVVQRCTLVGKREPERELAADFA